MAVGATVVAVGATVVAVGATVVAVGDAVVAEDADDGATQFAPSLDLLADLTFPLKA